MPSLTQAAPPKSDQLNADDLIGGAITITINEVRVFGEGDQRVNVYYDGCDGKPYKPCKSMIRVMAHVWGDESDNAVNQSMTLFCDKSVKFGGEAVGGIRISHMTGLNGPKSFGLTATRGRRKKYTVQPLNVNANSEAYRDGPSPDEIDAAMAKAKDAASRGTDVFKVWYASDEGKALRHITKPRMGDLIPICEQADANADLADE